MFYLYCKKFKKMMHALPIRKEMSISLRIHIRYLITPNTDTFSAVL